MFYYIYIYIKQKLLYYYILLPTYYMEKLIERINKLMKRHKLKIYIGLNLYYLK